MSSPLVPVLHLQGVADVLTGLGPVTAAAAVSPAQLQALGSHGGALQAGRRWGQGPGLQEQGLTEGTRTHLILSPNLHTGKKKTNRRASTTVT